MVTGAGGFVGRHLADHLRRRDWQVVATRHASDPVAVDDSILLDLLDADLLEATLREVRPDAIFHLAGQSDVGGSWKIAELTYRTNVIGQLQLFEALVRLEQRPRVLVVGSNEEYGLVRPEETPVVESNPLRPANPYAVSKVAQDFMGYQYFVSHGIPCVRVRPFNHVGPGQRDAFVIPAFARQIAEIEMGIREPVLRVGNLGARRDFTDVRDMVRAYELVLVRGDAGDVYNLGSGRAVSIASVLESLVALSSVRLVVEPDPTRMRPVDIPLTLCDYSKAAAATGWRPEIPLERTLRDVLDDWRARVAKRGLE